MKTISTPHPTLSPVEAERATDSFDDIATRMLGEMFRSNCAHAVKLLGIGDTAGAREFLTSALQQLDQIESHQPQKVAKETKQLSQPVIEA